MKWLFYYKTPLGTILSTCVCVRQARTARWTSTSARRSRARRVQRAWTAWPATRACAAPASRARTASSTSTTARWVGATSTGIHIVWGHYRNRRPTDRYVKACKLLVGQASPTGLAILLLHSRPHGFITQLTPLLYCTLLCAVGSVSPRRALRGRAGQLQLRLRRHGLRGRRLWAQHRRVRATALPQRRHLPRRSRRLPLQLLPRLHR